MRKRIISLILAVCLILTMAPVSLAYTDLESASNADAINLIAGLGIMNGYEDGTFRPEETITRAQMAEIINNIYTYNKEKAEASWEFFGELSTSLLQPGSGGEVAVFDDVNQNHWAYSAISNVNMLGLMLGTSSKTFEPEANVSVNEAVKVIVELLGYKVKANLYGGYPAGHLRVASELKLLSKITNKDKMTRADMAVLINNALNIELLRQTSYSQESNNYKTIKGETLLTEVLGINKVTDKVTQNSITSLTGKSSLSNNEIQIGDLVLKIGEQTKYLEKYIGREIDCYYKNHNSEDELDVVYGVLTGKDEFITFDLEDFEDFTGNTLVYNEGDETNDVSILSGAYMIYNGLAVTNYSKTNFDFESGTVTLVSTTGGSIYDLIIVEGYESWYINSIDKSDYIVYNKLKDSDPMTDDVSIVLDTTDSQSNVTIVDKSGNPVKFEDLSAGMSLDISRNGNVIKAIASKDIVKDYIVNGHDTQTNEISNGENTYDTSRSYLSASSKMFYEIGQKYNLYLNSFGKIVWVESADVGSWKMGYVLKFGPSKDVFGEITMQAKVLISDKTFKVYDIIKNVLISDNLDVSNTYTPQEALNKLSNFNNAVIRYKLNLENKITEIELPLDVGLTSSKPERLYTMLITNNDTTSPFYKDNYYISSNQFTFGGKVFVDEKNSKILNIPPDLTNEDNFNFIPRNNISDGNHIVKAYGTNQRSVLARYVCLSIDSTTTLSDQNYPMIVTKITNVADSEGEVVTKITGFRSGAEVEILDKKSNGFAGKAVDRTKTGELYSVSAGDIIRYTTDANGYVTYIEMLFDSDGSYNNTKYGLNDGLNYTQKGILAGTIGYFMNTYANTNPLTLTAFGPVTSNSSNKYNSGAPRFILGYVYDVQDGFVTYTTQNLNQEEFNPNDTKFVVESRSTDFNASFVEYKGKKVIARKGAASDFKTYKDYGKNCSRILVMTASADKRYMIIINGEVE